MTDATPLRLSSADPVRRSQSEYGALPVKNPAYSDRDHACASRRWFAALLWRAFPAPSEADLALKAARVLDVSPRQVKNWLRCEHDASLRYVTAVLAIAGGEVIFGRIEGRS
jgi:hypothetical protein